MISLEKAKALKVAGLLWEYTQSDCFYYNYPYKDNAGFTHTYRYPGNKFVYSGKWGSGFSGEDAEEAIRKIVQQHIFAPRLSQLLTEIEKRGWNADSVTLKDGGYGCDIYWLSATVQTIYKTFAGESREDAVADALIWIKRKGAGK